ncbi:Putative ATP-dependent RNA helicase PB1A10.06c [Cytospora mali]|uniref:RNA helicase n=1 Tax=Cytospora mali TaxID=578113 RepID=A0A194W4K8_CYTMA|nr:Putative ATP-dependent RNA helicase PB1A10.06c [Valsa mali]
MAKFVPRQRKQRHRGLARDKRQSEEQNDLSNAQEILPEHVREKEERKARMREELRNQGVKVSSKKAKRLDKYIENKLKRDENRELLVKLAENQVDTSLFASSRALGHNRETKREALTRAFRERQAGIETEENEKILFEERKTVPEAPENAESSSEDEELREATGKAVRSAPNGAAKEDAASMTPVSMAVGSGLKRPLEVSQDGRPVLAKRQKRGGVKSKIDLSQPVSQLNKLHVNDTEGDWSGFSDEEDIEDSDEDGDSSEQANSEDESEDDSEEGSGSEESSEGDSDEASSSGEEDSEVDEEAEKSRRKERSSAFKQWAHQQRNEAMGYKPVDSATQLLQMPKPANFTPRPLEQDPLPLELQPTKDTDRKAYSVTVSRPSDIQEARLKLPVVAEEQRIMEAIHNNDIVVLCGATGSGKTTQVPQFLFEAGYGSRDGPTPGMIGVTQPRRVAAVSMSKRVGQELGDHSNRVAYQIRFEGTVDPKTAVKFMTDGVLLREVAQDIALKKYSAIIVDEAHERSVNTDILVGMLSRVVKLRGELAKEDPTIKPLKLIIMSATLRIEDMTQNPTLFKTPPPVLEVEGRQFPVTVHFSRRTQGDYVEEAFKKISRGHKKLPPGGILVFMTGQNEIMQLSKRLKMAFTGMDSAPGPRVRIPASEAPIEAEDIDFGDTDDRGVQDYDEDPISGNEEEDDEAEFEIPEEEGETGTGPNRIHVLPLYSLLPTKEQMRVFETPPDGSRLVILATNVAETSLTIPGIRYVFDCGRSKERKFDRVSGVQSFEVGWISKASASQRSGRAGRTGPGHCYRLYSSAVYERDFQEFAEPELLRMPIEGVVLQLKAMNLQHVVNFPFPTPPGRQSLVKAERLLTYLSAINDSGQVTQIGKTMSIFPLSPRFARILLVGHQYDCIHYTIALIAGLSAAEVFLPELQAVPQLAAKEDGEDGERAFRTNADIVAEELRANARRAFNAVHKNFCFLDDKSDAIKLLQAVGEFAHEPTEQWCESHFVRFKTLREIQQLRQQITDLLRTNITTFAGLAYQDKLPPPSAKQITALKQMVAAGFIDQVAIRADKAPTPFETGRKPRRAIDVPYLPLTPLDVPTDADPIDRVVYIHPSSPLAHLSPGECPDYVVYSYLQKGQPGGAEGERKAKTRMHTLTDVTGGQIAALAKGTPLISYGKPIKEVSVSEGGKVREVWVIPYLRAEGTGGMGWPLPARKVNQKKVPGKGWIVE